MKYYFLLLLLSLNSFAETKVINVTKEEVPAESRISDYKMDWKYSAGEYFIYDCERGHYACVTEEGNSNCKEERNFAIEKKTRIYPCAPLAKFTDKKSCVEKSYRIVDLNVLRRFCYPK